MRPVKQWGGFDSAAILPGEGRVRGFAEEYHVESWHSGKLAQNHFLKQEQLRISRPIDEGNLLLALRRSASRNAVKALMPVPPAIRPHRPGDQ